MNNQLGIFNTMTGYSINSVNIENSIYDLCLAMLSLVVVCGLGIYFIGSQNVIMLVIASLIVFSMDNFIQVFNKLSNNVANRNYIVSLDKEE